MMGKGKKGISPLIATILLIAFAVALGAVVMSWGRDPDLHGLDQEMVEACRGVSIDIEKIGGVEQISYINADRIVRFTVLNSGSRDISQLMVTIIGDRETYVADLRDSSIRIGHPFSREINYNINIYGEIMKVRITPRIRHEGSTVACTRNSIEFEKITVI